MVIRYRARVTEQNLILDLDRFFRYPPSKASGPTPFELRQTKLKLD
jgi:hypothetical protein